MDVIGRSGIAIFTLPGMHRHARVDGIGTDANCFCTLGNDLFLIGFSVSRRALQWYNITKHCIVGDDGLSFDGHPMQRVSLVASHDDRYLYFAWGGHCIHVIDSSSRAVVQTINYRQVSIDGDIMVMTALPDGNLVLGTNDTLSKWCTTTGNLMAPPFESARSPGDVCVSADGTRLLVSWHGYGLKIHSSSTLELLSPLVGDVFKCECHHKAQWTDKEEGYIVTLITHYGDDAEQSLQLRKLNDTGTATLVKQMQIKESGTDLIVLHNNSVLVTNWNSRAEVYNDFLPIIKPP